jgi:hypothetical protein
MDHYAFTPIIAHMGHDHKPSVKVGWTTDEMYCLAFYSSVVPRNYFLKILKFLHFVDNHNRPIQDRKDLITTY